MDDINIIVMLLNGLIWLQDACKLRKNVYCLSNIGSFCTCQVSACVTRRECCGLLAKESIHFWQGKVLSHLQRIHTTSEASLASYSVHTQDKVAVPGSKPLISVQFCVPPVTSIALYVVHNETWGQLYFIQSVFMLNSVAHNTSCYVNNRRWITI
jgi:hypothetical protein